MVIPNRPWLTPAMKDAGLDLGEWITREIADKMMRGTGIAEPQGVLNATATSAAAEQIHADTRLIQVLRGVKAGTIGVEDAALEIIQARGLDRKTTLLGSDVVKLVESMKQQPSIIVPEHPNARCSFPLTINEARTKFGLDIIAVAPSFSMFDVKS